MMENWDQKSKYIQVCHATKSSEISRNYRIKLDLTGQLKVDKVEVNKLAKIDNH